MDREITLCLTYFILRPDAFLRCDACHYYAERKNISLSIYMYIVNASNAILYDGALIASYSGQILAFYYQPNL